MFKQGWTATVTEPRQSMAFDKTLIISLHKSQNKHNVQQESGDHSALEQVYVLGHV